MTYAVFTGVYRNCPTQSVDEKLSLLNKHGIASHFFSWTDDLSSSDADMLRDRGVYVHQYDPPFPHTTKGVSGRERQIFLARKAIEHFSGNPILLKLRWDIEFSEELLENITSENYLKSIENGFLNNKVWCSFYSIQELFSVSDQAYCGHREDLDKLVRWKFKINDRSAYDYISHDGMHLCPALIAENEKVCKLLLSTSDPLYGSMWNVSHVNHSEYLYAWAYSYYLLDKYFKTGPQGTLYFPKGDASRWENNRAIVNYDVFLPNYQTIGKGGLPKYRVYDDVFVRRVVDGEYQDEFAENIKAMIDVNRDDWV